MKASLILSAVTAVSLLIPCAMAHAKTVEAETCAKMILKGTGDLTARQERQIVGKAAQVVRRFITANASFVAITRVQPLDDITHVYLTFQKDGRPIYLVTVLDREGDPDHAVFADGERPAMVQFAK